VILGFFLCLLDRVEHLLSFDIEYFTLRSERQLASLMIEKLQGELLFECLDLQRYGRRSEKAALGGVFKRAALHDPAETV
jgi:hypothetical protein